MLRNQGVGAPVSAVIIYRYSNYTITFNKDIYKDVYKTTTIIFIYSRPIYSFIILNIIKERVIKPFNIININKLIFFLNIYR